MSIVVPHDQLEPETLWAVIEDFVTRDGAIQGHLEISLAEKMKAVQRRLNSGTAVIVFDHAEETFSIVPSDEWLRSSRNLNEAGGDTN
jgi:uncharacterized protein YheU (UPF0270 family)